QNVGLTLEVECFTGDTIVLAVELDQVVEAQVLFLHFDEGSGAALHYFGHVLDDGQDVAVVVFQQCRVRTRSGGGGWWGCGPLSGGGGWVRVWGGGGGVCVVALFWGGSGLHCGWAG